MDQIWGVNFWVEKLKVGERYVDQVGGFEMLLLIKGVDYVLIQLIEDYALLFWSGKVYVVVLEVIQRFYWQIYFLDYVQECFPIVIVFAIICVEKL